MWQLVSSSTHLFFFVVVVFLFFCFFTFSFVSYIKIIKKISRFSSILDFPFSYDLGFYLQFLGFTFLVSLFPVSVQPHGI